jgi:ribonuclease Y
MTALFIVVALAAGVAAGYLVRRYLVDTRLAGAQGEAQRVLRDAQREAETTIKEARLEAKEELHKIRSEVDADLRERRLELKTSEERVAQREEQLERRAAELERRDQQVFEREGQTAALAEQLKAAHAEQTAVLEHISGLTGAQAKEMLLREIEDDARHDMAKLVRSVEEEAKHEADRRARNILSLSIQRTAATTSPRRPSRSYRCRPTT